MKIGIDQDAKLITLTYDNYNSDEEIPVWIEKYLEFKGYELVVKLKGSDNSEEQREEEYRQERKTRGTMPANVTTYNFAYSKMFDMDWIESQTNINERDVMVLKQRVTELESKLIVLRTELDIIKIQNAANNRS